MLHVPATFAAFPEAKCRPQTRSFASICSDKSSRLIAEIHRDRLSFDNFSASSPWFVTTDGTREKWRPLSLVLLLPQSTIKQNTIFAWSMQARLFTLLVHQYGGVATVAKLLVTWVKTIYKMILWLDFMRLVGDSYGVRTKHKTDRGFLMFL